MALVTAGYPHGTFCWVDLETTDPEGARSFYGGLLGWEFADAGGGYTLCRLEGSEVAGLHGHAPDARWSSYVCVEDAEAAVARAQELGGSVLRAPQELPGTARVAVIRDPAGAELCLWEPGGLAGARLVNDVGAWSWNELTTPDLSGAKGFYGELFGWTAEDASGGIGRVTFSLGRLLVAGMHPPMPFEQGPPGWTISFRVADADETAERGTALGGSVLLPPFDVPIGRMGVLADPAGAAFLIASVPGGSFRGVDGS